MGYDQLKDTNLKLFKDGKWLHKTLSNEFTNGSKPACATQARAFTQAKDNSIYPREVSGKR